MVNHPLAAPERTTARSATEVVVRAVGVTRRYGDTTALDGLDLEVRAGELVGLLGPNGAGKSTLINVLTGLRRPTGGRCELFGQDPRTPAGRRHIGVTPQETGLPETLRVREVVDFVAAHYPASERRDALLDAFGLGDLAHRQTGGLSGGQKRRLAVALAFVGRPRLVFLDEPTTGLDVEARRVLWDRIRAFHEEGGTVVLTSHYLEEVEALAKRVVVVSGGRVLADDSVTAIRGMVDVQRVSLVTASLPPLPGVIKAEEADGRTHVLTRDADQFVRDLVGSGAPFSGLEIRPTTLEEAFMAIASA